VVTGIAVVIHLCVRNFARLQKNSKSYKISLYLKCCKPVFLEVLFLAYAGTAGDTYRR
jgi:hypothetical protein